MSGTIEGARAAAKTIKEKYGADYYAKIGAEGGKKGTTGGFAYAKANGLDWHREAGRKGGRKSRRK